MATITASTTLDEASGTRTSGESWTMENGAKLTIRTDTRWHAKSPASMTGSIGATTCSATQGGSLLIDATKVRWLAIAGGSGTSEIGTTVTQGGVTGIFLGYWADLLSAPSTTIGATGFIKFLEVTNGPFAAGALVFGAGTGAATAAGADVTGWIEVVQRTAVANTVPRLGKFETRGDWFYLDNTTGSAGQILQVPTNGGGANTHVPAVWIETATPGIYEIFPCILAAVMSTTNLGTDERSKFCQTMGNGQVRIGNNGTTNVGFVPPAGRKVRVPNIFGRQSSSAGGDANNLVPHATLADRPDWTTTSSGDIDLEFFMNDWYFLFASPYKVRIKNCATFDIHSTSNEASATDIDNLAVSPYNGASVSLTALTNVNGGTIKDSKFFRTTAATTAHSCTITTSAGYTVERCHFGILTYARSTGIAIVTNQSLNLTFKDCYQYNGNTRFVTSFNISVEGLDHNDRFVGNTNATTGIYCVDVQASSDNIKVDGLTFGQKGVVSAFCNPYLSPFYSINSSNVTFRNAGTRTNPLRVENTTNAPQYAVHDAGVNTNIVAQRIYLQQTRTSAFLTVNTSKNIKFESVHGTVGALQALALNAVIRNLRATSNSVTGGTAVYGTHVFDMFTSDTDGRLWFAMNEPTNETQSLVQVTTAAAGGFTSAGQVALPAVDDSVTIEMGYFAKGHTAFAFLSTMSPIFTGANPQNFNYFYDIDKGPGFAGNFSKNLMKIKVRSAGGTSGTNTITVATTASVMPEVGDYIIAETGTGITQGTTVTDVTGQVITVSNNFTAAVTGNLYFLKALPDEVISASTGFKLRVRIVAAVAALTNAITYIRLNTTTTLAAQTDNLYPLDTANATLSLTGLTAGTTVVVFNNNYTQELKRETIGGTSFSYAYEWISDVGNFNVNVLIWKNNKIPFITTVTLGQVNQSLPLSQSDDLVYNSVYTNTHTIDFANKLIILNSGEYQVQEVYSRWKDQMLLTTNAQYAFAFSQVGGNLTGGANSIPFYTFLSNGWKVRPEEASGTVNVVGGVLLSDDGSDPFVDTLGAYTVRINYQQPVQAITVSTGGGGGATPAEIWGFGTRRLSSSGITDITTPIRGVDNRDLTEVYDKPGGGGETKEDIYTYFVGGSRPDPFKANVSALATQASVDGKPTLAQIEGSSVLAKEATVAGKASQTSVDAIPTTPLLAANYTAPDNTGISDIKAKTDNLPVDPASNTQVNTRLAAVSYVTPDNTGISDIKSVTNKLDTAVELDGAVYRFTKNALEEAPSGSGPSATDIADAVWDEILSEHSLVGTTGKAIIDLLSAGGSLTPEQSEWLEKTYISTQKKLLTKSFWIALK